MILKTFQLKNNLIEKYNFYLFYGINEGHKRDVLNDILKGKNVLKYDEEQVFNNENNFIEEVLNKSLFEEEKIFLIKRVTDKILKIINTIYEKNNNSNETKIILNANILEKKSKLRNIFEKNKEFIAIPFYPDNEQTLSTIAFNFIKQKKILISRESINFIINKCGNNRGILIDELQKIEFFSKNGKTLNSEKLGRLINLYEDHSVFELADNCLAKNKKKIINIFNENNFTNSDCILIIKTLLNKSKKVLSLVLNYEENKNIEKTITSSRPPIFWKDKDITKKQILSWNSKSLKKYLFRLHELELNIKKNLDNSLNLISDFILKKY